MEFIIEKLSPILGTTIIGLTAILLLTLLALVITALVTIKDYKDIKSNFVEMASDVKKKFVGKANRKNLFVLLLVFVIIASVMFTISAIILYEPEEKTLKIINPIEKTTQDIWEEMTIQWEPIKDTGEYCVSIYPAKAGMHSPIEYHSFYVDGDETSIKICLGNFIYGTGM